MRDVRVGAVCMHSAPGDIEGNLEKTESFAREAAGLGVDILCFPELSLTGYGLKEPGSLCPRARSEEILQRVAETARVCGITIMAGMIEWSEGERPHISQIVAGKKGLLAQYRKTHLSPPETRVFQPGQEINVLSERGVTFGVQLCYEAHFPEISTLMALKGADIVFIPHASPRGSPEDKGESWRRHLPARAFDNALFVVACNQVGNTSEGFSFPGIAMVINPAGRTLAEYRGNDEHLLTADLSGGELRGTREHRMRYFLPHRRPELYGGIVSAPEQSPCSSGS